MAKVWGFAKYHHPFVTTGNRHWDYELFRVLPAVLAAGRGNPVFDNELNYPSLRHPDSGFQLLALFRFWNRMQYFNPNREIMGDDPAQASAYWSGVLNEFIRPFATAQDRLSYQLSLDRHRRPAENPLQIGDVITHLGGAAIFDLVNDWRRFYPAFNEPTRLRDIARCASPLPPPTSAKSKALAGSSSTSATTRRSSSSSPSAN